MNFIAFQRTRIPSHMFLEGCHVISISHFLCKLRNFLRGLSIDKREFSSDKVVFLPTYRYLLHCQSHPYEISMQILKESTHVVGSSVKVSNRFINPHSEKLATSWGTGTANFGLILLFAFDKYLQLKNIIGILFKYFHYQ